MASNETEYNWDHADPSLVSTRRRIPRYLRFMREPIYPTTYQVMEIHPEIKSMPRLRLRSLREYIPSQNRLETDMEEGLRDLEDGVFYGYLEEEYDMDDGTVITVRFGNVFEGDHWVFKIAAFPKNHPDGEHVPYKMKNIS